MVITDRPKLDRPLFRRRVDGGNRDGDARGHPGQRPGGHGRWSAPGPLGVLDRQPLGPTDVDQPAALTATGSPFSASAATSRATGQTLVRPLRRSSWWWTARTSSGGTLGRTSAAGGWSRRGGGRYPPEPVRQSGGTPPRGGPRATRGPNAESGPFGRLADGPPKRAIRRRGPRGPQAVPRRTRGLCARSKATPQGARDAVQLGANSPRGFAISRLAAGAFVARIDSRVIRPGGLSALPRRSAPLRSALHGPG